MGEQKTPMDRGSISDEERAWMEFDVRNGRTIQRPGQPPSRSKFGRALDFFERLFGAGGRNGGASGFGR